MAFVLPTLRATKAEINLAQDSRMFEDTEDSEDEHLMQQVQKLWIESQQTRAEAGMHLCHAKELAKLQKSITE